LRVKELFARSIQESLGLLNCNAFWLEKDRRDFLKLGSSKSNNLVDLQSRGVSVNNAGFGSARRVRIQTNVAVRPGSLIGHRKPSPKPKTTAAAP
jgi:hypothetical protein